MKPSGAIVALLILGPGCGHAPESVVGTWEAFLGSGSAAKVYYGKPAPTEIEFREDGTYVIHLMWGSRSIAETGGTYEVSDDRITLSPRENLDRETWPPKEVAVMDDNRRAFTLKLPPGFRVPEARFYKERGSY